MNFQPGWFGGRLKELRVKEGLTQPALAERTGMNRFGVAKIEQGVTLPSWETVARLCDALGCTPNDFAREPGPLPESVRGRPPKPAEESPRETPRPRGRPRKAAETAPAPKRPRGRPKKAK